MKEEIECKKSPTGKHIYKCIFADDIPGRPLEKQNYLIGTLCIYCLEKERLKKTAK